MSKPYQNEHPLLSREECDTLLPVCCINAMKAYKLTDKTEYNVEIDTLSRICHNLITHYKKSPHAVVAQMEKAMTDAHNHEIEEIDNKIRQLFKLRKSTPANSFYCEQQIIKFTTEITILEERKLIPIKDTVEDIICQSLDRAIKVLGTEMPAHFNLVQYEYHPVLTEDDSVPQKENNDDPIKPFRSM